MTSRHMWLIVAKRIRCTASRCFHHQSKPISRMHIRVYTYLNKKLRAPLDRSFRALSTSLQVTNYLHHEADRLIALFFLPCYLHWRVRHFKRATVVALLLRNPKLCFTLSYLQSVLSFNHLRALGSYSQTFQHDIYIINRNSLFFKRILGDKDMYTKRNFRIFKKLTIASADVCLTLSSTPTYLLIAQIRTCQSQSTRGCCCDGPWISQRAQGLWDSDAPRAENQCDTFSG